MKKILLILSLAVGLVIGFAVPSQASGDCPVEESPLTGISCLIVNALSSPVTQPSGGSAKRMQMLSITLVP